MRRGSIPMVDSSPLPSSSLQSLGTTWLSTAQESPPSGGQDTACREGRAGRRALEGVSREAAREKDPRRLVHEAVCQAHCLDGVPPAPLLQDAAAATGYVSKQLRLSRESKLGHDDREIGARREANSVMMMSSLLCRGRSHANGGFTSSHAPGGWLAGRRVTGGS